MPELAAARRLQAYAVPLRGRNAQPGCSSPWWTVWSLAGSFPTLDFTRVKCHLKGTPPTHGPPHSYMLESLKTLFADLTDGQKHPSRFGEDDYRLAAAALLIHAALIDGSESEAATRKLHDVLMRRFDLDTAATAELVEKAKAADRDAVDLYHFTKLINQACDLEGRLRIIQMMWAIVFADGEATTFEDNLLWRVADLLGISAHERIALRRRAASEQADPGDSA